MEKIVQFKEDNVSMAGALQDMLSEARKLGANVDSLASAVYSFERWMREEPGIPL